MKYLLIPLTLLALACGPACMVEPERPGPASDGGGQYVAIKFHGDLDFSPSERKQIEDTMADWAGATGGLAQVTVVWDLDFNSVSNLQEHMDAKHHVLIRDSIENPYNQDDSGNWDGTLGHVSRIGGSEKHPVALFLVADQMEKYQLFKPVVLHELGHAMGLEHLQDPDTVMYGSVGKDDTCLTRKDIAEYCRANVCGNTPMHWCTR